MFYIKLCKIKVVLIFFNKKKFCENKIYKFCLYIYNKFRNCCDLFWYLLDIRKNYIIENLGFSL